MKFDFKNSFHVRKLAAAPKKKGLKIANLPLGTPPRLSYREGSNHIKKGLYVTGILKNEK